MKKSHILKKKEARFRMKLNELGPVTDENWDTYPIGNPFAKISMADLEFVSRIMREMREKMTDEQKKEIKELQDKFIKEANELLYNEKIKKTRRLFIKD